MKANHLTTSGIRQFTAAVLLLAGGASAHAAPIIWGSPTGISGDGDVSTNGLLVDAFNIAGVATTVNGVLFQAFPVGSVVNTVGNYTLEIDPNNQFDVLDARDTGSTNAPYQNLTAAYQSLVGTAGADGENIDLTIEGLTLGQNYAFQIWVNNSEDTTGFDVSVEATNSVGLSANGPRLDGALGQFVTGTFIADGTSQLIEVKGSEVVVANAFQLRRLPAASVPEPATLYMLALGLVGMTFTRRR